LVPKINRTFEIHLGNTEPHGFIYLIYGEILLTATTPTARVLSVEFWEGKLG
jgi:hypothetical protein